jgi:hypothetical protein
MNVEIINQDYEETKLYIKKEDFNYLEGLYKTLDEGKRKAILDHIKKEAARKAGEDVITKILIVDADMDREALDSASFITRTMIKKAYKAAKGG